MWAMAIAQAGQTVSQYVEARKSAKYAKKVQAYQNRLKEVSYMLNFNTSVTNEVLQTMDINRQAKDIQRTNIRNISYAAVSAAAAGVGGNSVTRTLLAIQANTGQAEKNRQESLQGLFRANNNQFLVDSFNYQNSLDQSRIKSPSLAMSLLGGLANFGNSDAGQEAIGSLFSKRGATSSTTNSKAVSAYNAQQASLSSARFTL